MLLEQIKLGTPLLWMKTEDVYRIHDFIIESNLRDFYSIQPELGFSKFVDGQWKAYLVDFPNPDDPNSTIQTTTYDLIVAYQHIIKQSDSHKATFVHTLFGPAAGFMDAYFGMFASSASKYRNAFFKDDLNSFPIQHVVLSTTECPEEYSSLFYVINPDPLSVGEIAQIVSHFHDISDGVVIDEKDSKEIIKAALGLSESTFINLSLISILKTGKVSSKFIYDEKMSKIKQHGILEIMKPKLTFDNIGGLDLAKDIIKRNVWLWNNPQEAENFGVQPIRRMLMVGIPGTGKSAICEATANELNLDLARTGVSQVMNSFVGQSEANMRAVFGQIKAMAPLCVWIDEFGRDMSGGSSSSHVDGGTTDRVHGEFLTGLQELPENVFLICAANQLEHLRPEMLRAERFDKIIFVGLPSLSERIDILNIYLKDIKTDHEFNLNQIAEATAGYTGAEIKALIKEVKFFVVSSELRTLNTSDIINYIPKMRNILWNKSRDMIKDLYKYAVDQWDFASSSQLEDAPRVIAGTYASQSTISNKKPQYSW